MDSPKQNASSNIVMVAGAKLTPVKMADEPTNHQLFEVAVADRKLL